MTASAAAPLAHLKPAPGAIYQRGIDWVTATNPERTQAGPLWLFGRELIHWRESQGETIWPASIPRYEGIATGGVLVARGLHGTLLQLTGSVANAQWRSAHTLAATITRVDLQVTVLARDVAHPLTEALWAHLEAPGAISGRSKSRSLIQTRPSGATLYCGSPKSDVRLRVYDKHAESKGAYPPGAWRVELQVRKPVADRVVAWLAEQPEPGTAIASYLGRRLEQFGLPPLFEYTATECDDTVNRDRSTTERALTWLRLQVAPTIRRLEKQGHAVAVRRALRGE